MSERNRRLIRLNFGLFLYAVGIVLNINAQIGYAPWDVFHAGLANTFPMTIGMASILVGAAIVLATYLLGEKIGLGTVLNMIVIGIYIDIFLKFGWLPTANTLFSGLIMITVGLFIISLATYYYVGSGFGAGPRDALMIAIQRITGFPIGYVRASIELASALIGWWLGGMFGIGTLYSAIVIGACVQVTFKALNFNPATIQHETLGQSYQEFVFKKAA